ncbi:SH3 domain-containing protein [Streptococcus catagoni]|uniref:SH3 domain-containing protein n=1 Tax=Streptococcus catagoni TaxID=2654874 RepID=UPI00140979DD|nr:SH3 domain-containing protein [Streptococcus catagoni]
MKKLKHFISIGLMVTTLFTVFPIGSLQETLFTTKSVQAAVLGDNYPMIWKTGRGTDSWGMFLRQCTSFVAFRLSHSNGFSLPGGYGNADTWGHIARRQGYLVDSQPLIGSVAWFDKGVNHSHKDYGHVSWVADVNGDYVTLEEYNYNAGQGPEKYHQRQLHKSQVSGFIHFKDLAENPSTSINSSVQRRDLLPTSGTYYFKEKGIVRAEAKLSSPELVHYQAGQFVHYDKIITADGYQWLSYIGASGNRRYIQIGERTSSEPVLKQENLQAQTIARGDTVTFPGVFRVTQSHGALISSADLAGGHPSRLNWIDPGPVNESDQHGNIAGDQRLYPGEYITIPGKYKVLQVDQKTAGIQVQIGSYTTWVTMAKAQKV